MAGNDAVIADLLSSLFHRLEREGVQYCVLRDYEGLPQRFRNDVDFLTRPEDCQRFHDILVEVAAAHGWRLVKHVRKFGLWFHYFYPIKDWGEGRFILHVDLFSKVAWWGITYLSADEILQHRVRHGLFFVPSPNHEAATLLLKDFLHVGCIRNRYRGRIQWLIQPDPDILRSCLRTAVGGQVSDFMVDRIRLGQWDDIKSQRRAIQRALAWRSFKRAPLAQMRDFFLFVWERQRQYLAAPKGAFVVVVGPDGSGKTTVIREVMVLLDKLFTRTQRLAFNFHLLPYIDDVRKWLRGRQRKSFGREEISGGPVLTPYPTYRVMASLAYHTIGYLLGYLYLFIARRLGYLVIMERYVYDYFIQPRYQRAPKRLLKIVQAIVPQPDALIYLHGDPQLIHNRKPELPIVEIERQVKILRDLVLRSPNGHIVEIDAPVSVVARRVAHVICRTMESKRESTACDTRV
ncbi:MAG: hypothetical protein QXZ09_01755 [Candidatus Methanomethylicaceae archaeon]